MQIILFTDVADTYGYGKYAGTYKVATEIRKGGYTCQVIDLFSFYQYSQLEKIIDKFVTKNTLLVGFGATLMEKRINGKVLNFGRPDKEFTDIASYVKSKNSKIKICLGGARLTDYCYWPGTDYIILNKADNVIIKLIKHLKDGDDIKIMKKDQCVYIDGNDYFYTQEQFAHSQIIYEPHDIIFQGESLPVEIARGCIFSCAFCRFDLIGKKAGEWQKNGEILKSELLRNYELYGTTHYMFTDELINENVPKMEFIHNILTSLPFKLTYTSYARLDLIWKFPEMRELLLESGAKSLHFGIETLNEVAGKKIGKGLGPTRIKETLSYCNKLWKNKIIASSTFIAGLPGESRESILESVDYLVSDDCPLDVFGFLPLTVRDSPDGRNSSKMDRDPKKFGIKIEKNQQWESATMNYQEAVALVKEINDDPRVRKKNKFGAATWVGRILNLGYSMEDLFKFLKDDTFNYESFGKMLNKRTLILKNQYYEKLMLL
jgi:radical SAM superfamily enzyme YgiQ (UPF0313 family)